MSTRKAYDLPGLEPVVEKDTAARVSRRRYPVMMNYVITEVPQVPKQVILLILWDPPVDLCELWPVLMFPKLI